MVLLFFGQHESVGRSLTFRVSANSRGRLIGEENTVIVNTCVNIDTIVCCILYL